MGDKEQGVGKGRGIKNRVWGKGGGQGTGWVGGWGIRNRVGGWVGGG